MQHNPHLVGDVGVEDKTSLVTNRVSLGKLVKVAVYSYAKPPKCTTAASNYSYIDLRL